MKINWNKMHIHGYNECVTCGCRYCQDAESVAEWEKAWSALAEAELHYDTAKMRYYTKRIKENQNFIMR